MYSLNARGILLCSAAMHDLVQCTWRDMVEGNARLPCDMET